MTEEEKQECARQYAKLCLELYADKHGELPVPPSKKKFHRSWKEIVDRKT